MAAVGLDGIVTDVELCGNLARPQALRDVCQHLLLAVGQLHAVGVVIVPLSDAPGVEKALAEGRFAGPDGQHGIDEFVNRRAF